MATPCLVDQAAECLCHHSPQIDRLHDIGEATEGEVQLSSLGYRLLRDAQLLAAQTRPEQLNPVQAAAVPGWLQVGAVRPGGLGPAPGQGLPRPGGPPMMMHPQSGVPMPPGFRPPAAAFVGIRSPMPTGPGGVSLQASPLNPNGHQPGMPPGPFVRPPNAGPMQHGQPPVQGVMHGVRPAVPHQGVMMPIARPPPGVMLPGMRPSQGVARPNPGMPSPPPGTVHVMHSHMMHPGCVSGGNGPPRPQFAPMPHGAIAPTGATTNGPPGAAPRPMLHALCPPGAQGRVMRPVGPPFPQPLPPPPGAYQPRPMWPPGPQAVPPAGAVPTMTMGQAAALGKGGPPLPGHAPHLIAPGAGFPPGTMTR